MWHPRVTRAADSDRRPGSVLVGLALLLLLALLAGAAPARAAVTHKLAGTFNEGGTLSEPGPIAVDTSTGSVYVVTGGSGFAGEKIEKFDASGNPANFSFLGTNSFEPCAFGGCIRGIAVDNSAGVNHGAIYIATTGNSIFVYRSSGQLLEPFRFSHIFQEGFINNEGPYCGVAVDSSGSFYSQHERLLRGWRLHGQVPARRLEGQPEPAADMAGGRDLPAARRRRDLQDQLGREPVPLHGNGRIHRHGHAETVADVLGRTGVAPVQDDRYQCQCLLCGSVQRRRLLG